MNAQDVKAAKTNLYLGMIPAFFSAAANYAVLSAGVWLTMEGRFSLGAVLMFQGFLSSFMSPAMTLVNAGQTIQEMRTQKQVSEALDRMGCTRLVIAHRLSTIRRCDRILVLDNGKIIEDGTYDELIEKNGFFTGLVERQRLDAAE